jgi:hypothetical protein
MIDIFETPIFEFALENPDGRTMRNASGDDGIAQ